MECPICYEALEASPSGATSCGHVFHNTCLNEWLLTRHTCPMCRTGVVLDAPPPVEPGEPRPFPFSCRTLAPWDEAQWGFVTASGFRLWLHEIMGGGLTRNDVQGLRAWCNQARVGDVVYLDDECRAVAADVADFEIRCNLQRVAAQ